MSTPSQAASSFLRLVPRALQPQQPTLLSEPSAEWRPAVLERLQELIRLPEGWDGYMAAPVNFINAMFAFQMLEAICLPNTLAPQIVPGPSGDLQIEWHTDGGDIELWVRGPNSVSAWRETPNIPDGEELTLTNDFSFIARWVKEMGEFAIAHAAAA